MLEALAAPILNVPERRLEIDCRSDVYWTALSRQCNEPQDSLSNGLCLI